MSLYRKILKQALKLTWENKYLWFFGLFAAFLGNGGDYQILAGLLGTEAARNLNFGDLIATNVFSGQSIEALKRLMLEAPLSFAVTLFIGLAVLALVVFVVWLVIVSQSALVNNSAGLIAGKKTSFEEGVVVGGKNFWPVFALNIAAKILIALCLYLITLPVVLSYGRINPVLANLFYLIFFLILVPLALAISFIIKYAIAFKVIKGKNIGEAIQRGWELFVDNWLVSIEMAVALFLINFLFGLAVILLVLILAVPFLFLGLVLYYLTSFIGFWLVISLALLLFLAIVIVSGSILATFQVSAWTGLFVELTGKGGVSKIVRVASSFIKS